MPQIIVTKVVKAQSGKVTVSFGKENIEFDSIATAQSWADAVMNRENLKRLAVAMMLIRQPALNNTSVFENRGLNVDFTAPTNVVTVI